MVRGETLWEREGPKQEEKRRKEESNDGDSGEGGKIQQVPWGFLSTFLLALLSYVSTRAGNSRNSVFFFPPQETQIKSQGWGKGVPFSFHGNISDSIMASLSYLNQHVFNKIIGCWIINMCNERKARLGGGRFVGKLLCLRGEQGPDGLGWIMSQAHHCPAAVWSAMPRVVNAELQQIRV